MSKYLIVFDDGSAGGKAGMINSLTGNVDFEPLLASRSGSARNVDGLFTLVPFTTSPPKIYRWDGGTTLTVVGTFSTVGNVTHVVPGFVADRVNSNFWSLSGIGVANPTTPSWRKYDITGALLNTVGPITTISNGVLAMAVSQDETIGYYYGGFPLNNQPIRRWDLINNVALSNLVANLGDADTSVQNIYKVDGSTDIVALLIRNDFTTVTLRIRRYTAAGSIVYDVLFGTVIGTDDSNLECCEDPARDSIWARWPGPPNYDISLGSRFQRLSLVDGSTISFVDNLIGLDGVPAPTCAFVAVGSIPPPPPSGIYYIKLGKTNDTLYYSNYFTNSTNYYYYNAYTIVTMIPNPFFII